MSKIATGFRLLGASIKRGIVSYICKHDNGYLSDRMRYRLFRRKLKTLGEQVLIRSGVIIGDPQNISIGNRVSIQENCFLSGYGGITIGNDVSIGNGTRIVSSEHQYETGIIRNNPLLTKPVVIEDNIWIGMNACILGGSIIHERTVIAAGAVVKGEVGPNGVYGGVPAKKIRDI